MKTYEQTVTFRKKIVVKAKNAEEANGLLEVEVDDISFGSGLDSEGGFAFSDDPVTCPRCKGDCEEPGNEDEEVWVDCTRCEGNGEIHPEEYHDDESLYK